MTTEYPVPNIPSIPARIEAMAASLWKSRTMWVSGALGVLALAQEYGEYLPEKWVHWLQGLAALLVIVFRVQMTSQAKKAVQDIHDSGTMKSELIVKQRAKSVKVQKTT